MTSFQGICVVAALFHQMSWQKELQQQLRGDTIDLRRMPRRVCDCVCVCVTVCVCVGTCQRRREQGKRPVLDARGPLGHVHRLRWLHMSSVRCALCGRVEGCATRGRLGAESMGPLLGVEWNGDEPCHMETGSS